MRVKTTISESSSNAMGQERFRVKAGKIKKCEATIPKYVRVKRNNTSETHWSDHSTEKFYSSAVKYYHEGATWEGSNPSCCGGWLTVFGVPIIWKSSSNAFEVVTEGQEENLKGVKLTNSMKTLSTTTTEESIESQQHDQRREFDYKKAMLLLQEESESDISHSRGGTVLSVLKESQSLPRASCDSSTNSTGIGHHRQSTQSIAHEPHRPHHRRQRTVSTCDFILEGLSRSTSTSSLSHRSPDEDIIPEEMEQQSDVPRAPDVEVCSQQQLSAFHQDLRVLEFEIDEADCTEDYAGLMTTPIHSLQFYHSYSSTTIIQTSTNLSWREQLRNLAMKAEREGRLTEALCLYGKWLKYTERTDTSDRDTVTVLHKIGIIHWKTGSYDKSLSVLKHIVKQFRHTRCRGSFSSFFDGSLPHWDATILCDVYMTIGRVHLSYGDNHAAKQNFKQSLSILECNSGGTSEYYDGEEYYCADSLRARGLHCLGMAYEAQGVLAQAMEHYQEALRKQRKIHGKSHVDLAVSLTSIGSVHEKLRDFDKAMDCYGKALQIYRRSGVCCSPVDVGVVLASIGWIQFQLRAYDAALTSYDESVRRLKASLGEKHRNVVSVQVQMAMIYTETGQYKEALKLYKQALNQQRSVLGDNHADVAITLESIGHTYAKLKNSNKAIEFAKQALLVRRKILGERHVEVGMNLMKLGFLYRSCGRKHLNAALRSFTAAKKIFSKENIDPGSNVSMMQVEREIRSILRPIVKWI